jgi:ribonucleoside-diphosphate reductase alpha chain
MDGCKSIYTELLTSPHYRPSQRAYETLILGDILSREETPQDFLERVINTVFSFENEFGTHPVHIRKLAEEFAEYMVQGYVMLGTPILTNAGRFDAALSSCAIVPVDLRKLNSNTEERIRSYYRQNMGSGFDFSKYENPLALLTWIDELSERETALGQYNRYIGNMGILHISHPSIQQFIEAKRSKDMKHFNISIDVTEDFMSRAENRESFALANGVKVDAAGLLEQIAENSWFNGDPGLIFLQRMNKDNPFFKKSKYIGTPPCAEMGLAEGETCHFGYINLSKFMINRDDVVEVDYKKLERVTQLLTRVLDNAIEYSLSRYPTKKSKDIARMKRKIGIGVCGLADMLIEHKFAYASCEARSLARDVLSFINYVSKYTSVLLGYERGSCLAMKFPSANKYLNGRFLEEKYASNPTRAVSASDWEQLANKIRKTRKLRNISTTALPPSGRTSILLDGTPSIEPIFSIYTNGKLNKNIALFLSKELAGNKQILEQVCQEALNSGSFQNIEILPSPVRECLKTAVEITSNAHIQMVADLAGLHGIIDESASKTVNLPSSATVADVKDIFLASFHLGLKNISIYRDGTKFGQPIDL